MAPEIEAAGVMVHALNARGVRDVGVVWRLARLLERLRYSHVLSFLVHANAAAASVSVLFPELRFFQSIQTTQPRPAWHWPVQTMAARAARKIIVPSPSVAEFGARRCGIPEEKFTVIPNAVAVEQFANLPREKSDVVRIGFLGRLDPVKRIDDLIAAYGLLAPGRYVLHIFGDGTEGNRLKTLARGQMGIHFRGAVQHPAEALRQMDMLVLPSEAEGFGLVLLEAMAAGVPVVASMAPGIRDVVEDGQTAAMFQVGDVGELAKRIAQITEDHQLKSRLIANGRQLVWERYTLDPVLDAYERVLGLVRPT